MGDTQHTLLPLDFNRSVVIEDRPERLTGDAGGNIDDITTFISMLAMTLPHRPDELP
jgi:hypothetical protein